MRSTPPSATAARPTCRASWSSCSRARTAAAAPIAPRFRRRSCASRLRSPSGCRGAGVVAVRMPPRESRISVPGASLYVRERGEGLPVVVLHGGPDFDRRYLLPDLDRLAAFLRLMYYDQRGRGLSAAGVRAEDVSMSSEMDDLDALRRRLGVETWAVLGHSWGAVLAIEYAVRHPERVSHLVLMNPA